MKSTNPAYKKKFHRNHNRFGRPLDVIKRIKVLEEYIFGVGIEKEYYEMHGVPYPVTDPLVISSRFTSPDQELMFLEMSLR